MLMAVLVALSLGGSLSAWRDVRVRWWPIALLTIVVQIALFTAPVDRQPWAIAWGAPLWDLSLMAILAVLLRNAVGHRCISIPWAIAALGVAMNLVVVGANGGYMPQAAQARSIAGLDRSGSLEPTSIQLRNVVPMGPETRFPWLGDVIPQPAWLPRANVVSVGDVVLAMGIAAWAFQVTMRNPRRTSAATSTGMPG